MAPDEGNMYLLERVASEAHKARFLAPLVAGVTRSAFLMTEPDGGAGSDPSMLQRSEEHTSELQSQSNLVCRLLLEKKKNKCNGFSQRIDHTSYNRTSVKKPQLFS